MLSRFARKYKTAVGIISRILRQKYLTIVDLIFPAYSFQKTSLLLRGRVFDEAWYAEKNKDLQNYNGKWVDHYFKIGIKEGRPARFFDAPWYKEYYADQASSKLDAWSHYCQFGFYEHRQARFFYIQSVVDRADIRRDYSQWLQLYEVRDKAYSHEISQAIALFRLDSKFYLNLILDKQVDLTLLRRTVNSILAQEYDNWRAKFFFTADVSVELKESVQRIINGQKYFSVHDNGINDEVRESAKEPNAFDCFLTDRDCLSSDALFWTAMEIHRQSNIMAIYSDEDTLSGDGTRSEPRFKPAFNYELLLSHNYLGQLVFFKAEILPDLDLSYTNAAVSAYEGILRTFEKNGAGVFGHIPRILNHSVPKSASTQELAKILRGHLKNSKRKGAVLPLSGLPGYFRVKYALPSKHPLVSVIIPTRDRVDLLRTCVDSILQKTTYSNYEIIIVDNGSKDPSTFAYFEKIESRNVTILRDSRVFNFSALNNDAVSISNGEFICMMNNDIEIATPEWIEEMLSFASQPDVGCVGAKLWYPDDTIQHAGVLVGFHGVAGHMHKFLKRSAGGGYMERANLHQALSAVTAAVMMVRKSIFDEVGGLDETLAVAFNDVDFCLKVRDAGYRNVYTPYAEMYHYESASRGAENSPEKKAREASEIKIIKDRYGAALMNDPSYNPNLSLITEDLSLAFPPRVPSLENIIAKTKTD